MSMTRKPDVVVAAGPETALLAARAAAGKLPIVMIAVDYDPIARGHVASLARPGGQISGVYFQVIGVTMQSQDSFNVQVSTRNEHLEQPFQIRRGITLPVGSDYTYSRVRGTWQTANRRTIAVGGRVETGQFYSGTRTETVANLTLRLRPG